MKHLLTLTALLVSSLAMAQMPYNPDSNGDDLIGSEDLLTFLGVYNTLLIDSSLTCDYEGTDLESWIGGLFDGTLVLDSVYVEYLLIDTVSTFLPGCPDPVDIETVLERSFILPVSYFYDGPTYDDWSGSDTHLGYYRLFSLRFYDSNGGYVLTVKDNEIEELTGFDDYSNWIDPSVCCDASVPLPFPQTWTLDEDGIQVDWDTSDWVPNCEHFRIIPYWHEAE